MPNRNCTIHGSYPDTYAICPKCAGAGPLTGDPTLASAITGMPDDERTLPPTKIRRGSAGDDATGTIPPRKVRGSVVGTIVEGPQVTGLLGWLIVKDAPGMRRGHILPLKPNEVYGRGTNAGYQINDEKMSDIHARIQRDDSSWKITDTGSTNGSWVNSAKIKETTVLQENDEIKMGASIFVLKVLL